MLFVRGPAVCVGRMIVSFQFSSVSQGCQTSPLLLFLRKMEADVCCTEGLEEKGGRGLFANIFEGCLVRYALRSAGNSNLLHNGEGR